MLFFCALNKFAFSNSLDKDSQKDQLPSYTLPKGAKYGLRVDHYKDELFNNLQESYVTETVDLKMKNSLHSYHVEGSFCPNETGKFNFKVDGKSYVSLKVGGVEYSKTSNPVGSCLPKLKEVKETKELTLYAHRCYPIEIDLKTGCALYSQWLKFTMQENQGQWKLADRMISTKYSDCIKGYYGDKCDNRCELDPPHGTCDDGRKGTGKFICEKHYYGSNCSTFCSPALTCSYHGECDGNGKCKCQPQWGGDDCSRSLAFQGSEETVESNNIEAQHDGKFNSDAESGSSSANLIIIICAVAVCVVVVVIILVVRRVQKKESIAENEDLDQNLVEEDEQEHEKRDELNEEFELEASA